jgi:hypothetical protein
MSPTTSLPTPLPPGRRSLSSMPTTFTPTPTTMTHPRTLLTAFLLVLTALTAAPSAQGQGLWFGNRFGSVLADLSGDAVGTSDTETIGMPMNLVLNLQFSPIVGIQAELLATGRGADAFAAAAGTDLALVEGRSAVRYLEIPLLFRLQLPVTSGPYAAALAGGSLAFRTEEGGMADAFSDTDAGLVFGGELGYTSGGARAFIDARYSLGLSDVLDGDAFGGSAPDVRSRGVAVTVGGAVDLRQLFQSR